MRRKLVLSLAPAMCVLALCVATVLALAPEQPPAVSIVGGPYKVIAADFTGDKAVDLALAYLRVGIVTVEQGDGHGHFAHLALNVISEATPSRMQNVHNLAHGDVDGDGLPDLVVGVSSNPPDGYRMKEVPLDLVQAGWRGEIVVARNMGKGRFQRMAAFPVASEAKGVRLADLDNDGRLDLLYTERGSGYRGDLPSGYLCLRQGLGDWKFGPAVELAAGPSAYYVETGDLNNDGFLDIIVPNEHAQTVQYWLNPGKQIFKDPRGLVHRTVEASPIPGRRSHAINDIRAADFNGDGKLDLVTANLGTSTVSIFLGNGDGTFQKDTLIEAGTNGAFLAVGDLDGDGDIDFVITHWTEDFLSVFLNKGNGQFAPRKDYKTGLGNYGVTLCDADGDGKLDAVTANYRERSISVLRGVGDGSFHPAVTTKKGFQKVKGAWVAE